MGKASRGFTIIELMVVIVISAILIMMAVPSYQSFIQRNNVQSLQSRMAAAIVSARSEAASRNGVVTMCSSNNGSTCTGSWNDGWIVFLDTGAGNSGIAQNAQHEVEEPMILSYSNVGNYKISVVDEAGINTVSHLSFNSQGFSMNEARALVTVCEPEGDVQYARGLIIERSGRTMITRDLNGEDGIHESRFDDGFGNVTVADLSC